jgi:hypothetical protein
VKHLLRRHFHALRAEMLWITRRLPWNEGKLMQCAELMLYIFCSQYNNILLATKVQLSAIIAEKRKANSYAGSIVHWEPIFCWFRMISSSTMIAKCCANSHLTLENYLSLYGSCWWIFIWDAWVTLGCGAYMVINCIMDVDRKQQHRNLGF